MMLTSLRSSIPQDITIQRPLIIAAQQRRGGLYDTLRKKCKQTGIHIDFTIVTVINILLSIERTSGITHLFSIPTRQWLIIQFIGDWSSSLFFRVQLLHLQLLLRMLFPKICQSSLPLPIYFRLHIYCLFVFC